MKNKRTISSKEKSSFLAATEVYISIVFINKIIVHTILQHLSQQIDNNKNYNFLI